MAPNSIASLTLVVLLSGLLSLRALAQEASPVANDGAKAAAAAATYPDSSDGLKSLLQDIIASARAGDIQQTSQFFTDFAIPNHGEWFAKTFGADEGARLEAKYVELQQANSTDSLQKLFDAAARSGNGVVEVAIYEKLENTTVPVLQAALRAMVQPVRVYSASLLTSEANKAALQFGRFVYVDGAFRQLNLQVLQALSTAPPMRIRVGGNVQSIKSIRKVPPVYPELARAKGIEGTVVLHVIIATDGTVKELQVLEGDPALQMAAVDAVRQWQYRPTLLNGMPVEVDTRIDVTFSLRR